MTFENDFLTFAHIHCSENLEELKESKNIGCFYCRSMVEFVDIKEWTDAASTALCPLCGIDSLIGDASGIVVTEVFLDAMFNRWFGK
jgi:hypothetical protein